MPLVNGTVFNALVITSSIVKAMLPESQSSFGEVSPRKNPILHENRGKSRSQ